LYLSGRNPDTASAGDNVPHDFYAWRQTQGPRWCSSPGRGNIDDETESQHPRKPLEHLDRWGVFSCLESRDMRLPNTKVMSEPRLRQPMLGAVIHYRNSHSPGEGRLLPACPKLRTFKMLR